MTKKAFDFVYRDKDGRLHAVEIVLSGSANLNASQAIKAATITGMATVTIACEDRTLMRNIETELKTMDELGLFRKKIAFRYLGEYSPH